MKTKGLRDIDLFLTKTTQGVKEQTVQVGFFGNDRYEDGTPVAKVATIHEFGAAHVPPRPFFRQAIKNMEKELPQLVADIIDPKTLRLDMVSLGKLGSWAAGQVAKRIIDLRTPPNSPLTIAAKRSDNPLIDTGKLLRSVTWKVRT